MHEHVPKPCQNFQITPMPVSPNALLVYIYDHLIVRKAPNLAENSKDFVNKMRCTFATIIENYLAA